MNSAVLSRDVDLKCSGKLAAAFCNYSRRVKSTCVDTARSPFATALCYF